MPKSTPTPKTFNFLPKSFDFADQDDALNAAHVVTRALSYMVGGLVARGINVSPTTDDEALAETITDGITRLFQYQLDLVDMAAGQGLLPFNSKGGEVKDDEN